MPFSGCQGGFARRVLTSCAYIVCRLVDPRWSYLELCSAQFVGCCKSDLRDKGTAPLFRKAGSNLMNFTSLFAFPGFWRFDGKRSVGVIKRLYRPHCHRVFNLPVASGAQFHADLI